MGPDFGRSEGKSSRTRCWVSPMRSPEEPDPEAACHCQKVKGTLGHLDVSWCSLSKAGAGTMGRHSELSTHSGSQKATHCGEHKGS